MIDWKSRCLGLAEIVDRHRREGRDSDIKLGWWAAETLIKMNKEEEQAQKLSDRLTKSLHGADCELAAELLDE